MAKKVKLYRVNMPLEVGDGIPEILVEEETWRETSLHYARHGRRIPKQQAAREGRYSTPDQAVEEYLARYQRARDQAELSLQHAVRDLEFAELFVAAWNRGEILVWCRKDEDLA